MLDFVFLTNDFYTDYPANNYPEIEHKLNRPYISVCLTINGYKFAIPLRSHITHPHAFITDKAKKCGVDYSKAVVITNEPRYIDKNTKPHIRPNEFAALKGKEYRIKTGMQNYITKYKVAKTSDKPVDKNLVLCSTLQYFENYI